ncbi:DUF1642 domain-containing protein [Lactiplantibacillus plantarum]|uniref:DUF1642 domain-containing protein n=1 Tax=Lactiplantibacillus plantarum TaxID=1590 RepID=UPI00155AB50B|nr:DUF1642 domain-containing protein [Lactiplantibacillus plantarum]WDT52051.1 DUF1642 domain-containing protein [Lactiplantibacillus plantarum]
MKVYLKQPIEAEQFDGSDEIIDRYTITPPMPLDPDYTINTLEGDVVLGVGDWIATGVNGKHWPIMDDVFKKTYAELPVIPECVNYAIEWFEQNDDDLGEVFRNAYEDLVDDWHECPQLEVAETWIINRPDEFARAWLDGYQVEE